MERKITISGGVEGVIATGSYQNLRPSFMISEEIPNCVMTDDQIVERAKYLYDKAYGMLKEAENKAITERIQRERADMRFLVSPATSILVPSVTSIINFDADFFVSAIDLAQYASQGNITHARVAEFIKSGKWKEPKEINDIWGDIVVLTKGSLGLSLDSGDFPAFLKEFSIDKMQNSEAIFNDKDGYCGTPDFTGFPKGWKEAKEILTVFDVKRTADVVKGGMQLSAYCKALDIKQGVLIPLNNKTKQGFSKPIVYDAKSLEGYYKMFLKQRENFKKRYGI